MADRDQLVRRWQESLDRNEAEFGRVSPHRRWLKHIYIRVYRFLLSVYGGSDWATGTEGPASTDGGSSGTDLDGQVMPLVDLRDDEGGRPPKDIAQIRQTLKTVHSAVTPPAQGPRSHGMTQSDWIPVVSPRDGLSAECIAMELRRLGIPFRYGGWGSGSSVEVRLVHHVEALDILERAGSRVRAHRQEGDHRTERSLRAQRRSRIIVGAWLGAVFFGALPLIVYLCDSEAPWPNPLTAELCVASLLGVGVGGAIGAMVGGLRRGAED